VHTHYDGQATWDAHLAPSSNLGTTTVVMGNCGVGFAPCRAEDHEVLIELMEGVEEIPGTALAEGLPWNWETFPEYLDALDARQRDIDVAALVPHGPVRVFVMGERGVQRESRHAGRHRRHAPGDRRRAWQRARVGFSTSRTLVHRSSRGDFIPTYQAATDELKQLGEALSGRKATCSSSFPTGKIRTPSSTFCATPAAPPAPAAPSLCSTSATGRRTARPCGSTTCTTSRAAQAEGLDIRGQVLSRPVGMLMGHPASMSPFSRRPTYLNLAALPAAQRLAELRKPEVRDRILAEQNVNPHMFVRIFEKRFDAMYPLEEPINYLPAPENSVAALAAV
jgi:N-acyl-D-amino-acid deacylase